jgi:hypothetical protein
MKLRWLAWTVGDKAIWVVAACILGLLKAVELAVMWVFALAGGLLDAVFGVEHIV